MVDILLLQTVSILVTSAGLLIAALYYVMQIRQQTRTRKTDLLVRLYSTMTTKDWLEAWEKFMQMPPTEKLDFDAYRQKHGLVEFNEVYLFFDQVGNLLRNGLIDINQVPFEAGQVKVTWEKIKPWLEVARKRLNEPKMGQGSEYLYNEMKKREQAGAKNG